MIISRNIYQRGRLTARPNNAGANNNGITGLQPLGLADERDGMLYVPETYTKNRPASLAIILHGAGGNASHGMAYVKNHADDHNIIVAAPASRARTWDIINQDAFGRDVILIDELLTFTFQHYSIDPSHIAIGGFSDGASYALSIGLTNGDLFTHILAFSPGFLYTVERNGNPVVFISPFFFIKRRLPMDQFKH